MLFYITPEDKRVFLLRIHWCSCHDVLYRIDLSIFLKSRHHAITDLRRQVYLL